MRVPTMLAAAAVVVLAIYAGGAGGQAAAPTNPLSNFIGGVQQGAGAINSAVSQQAPTSSSSSSSSSSTSASSSASSPVSTSSSTAPPASSSSAAAAAAAGSGHSGLSNGAKIGIIVGSVIAGVFLLGLLIGLCCCLCLRRRRSRKDRAVVADDETKAYKTKPTNPGRDYTPVGGTGTHHPMEQHATTPLMAAGAIPHGSHSQAPSLSQHPAMRSQTPNNPFSDATSSVHQTPRSSHHGLEAAALGAGAAGAAGYGMHHHNQKNVNSHQPQIVNPSTAPHSRHGIEGVVPGNGTGTGIGSGMTGHNNGMHGNTSPHHNSHHGLEGAALGATAAGAADHHHHHNNNNNQHGLHHEHYAGNNAPGTHLTGNHPGSHHGLEGAAAGTTAAGLAGHHHNNNHQGITGNNHNSMTGNNQPLGNQGSTHPSGHHNSHHGLEGAAIGATAAGLASHHHNKNNSNQHGSSPMFNHGTASPAGYDNNHHHGTHGAATGATGGGLLSRLHHGRNNNTTARNDNATAAIPGNNQILGNQGNAYPAGHHNNSHHGLEGAAAGAAATGLAGHHHNNGNRNTAVAANDNTGLTGNNNNTGLTGGSHGIGHQGIAHPTGHHNDSHHGLEGAAAGATAAGLASHHHNHNDSAAQSGPVASNQGSTYPAGQPARHGLKGAVAGLFGGSHHNNRHNAATDTRTADNAVTGPTTGYVHQPGTQATTSANTGSTGLLGHRHSRGDGIANDTSITQQRSVDPSGHSSHHGLEGAALGAGAAGLASHHHDENKNRGVSGTNAPASTYPAGQPVTRRPLSTSATPGTAAPASISNTSNITGNTGSNGISTNHGTSSHHRGLEGAALGAGAAGLAEHHHHQHSRSGLASHPTTGNSPTFSSSRTSLPQTSAVGSGDNTSPLQHDRLDTTGDPDLRSAQIANQTNPGPGANQPLRGLESTATGATGGSSAANVAGGHHHGLGFGQHSTAQRENLPGSQYNAGSSSMAPNTQTFYQYNDGTSPIGARDNTGATSSGTTHHHRHEAEGAAAGATAGGLFGRLHKKKTQNENDMVSGTTGPTGPTTTFSSQPGSGAVADRRVSGSNMGNQMMPETGDNSSQGPYEGANRHHGLGNAAAGGLAGGAATEAIRGGHDHNSRLGNDSQQAAGTNLGAAPESTYYDRYGPDSQASQPMTDNRQRRVSGSGPLDSRTETTGRGLDALPSSQHRYSGTHQSAQGAIASAALASAAGQGAPSHEQRKGLRRDDRSRSRSRPRSGVLRASTDADRPPTPFGLNSIGQPYEDMHVHVLQTEPPSRELRRSLQRHEDGTFVGGTDSDSDPPAVPQQQHRRQSRGYTTPPQHATQMTQQQDPRASTMTDSNYDSSVSNGDMASSTSGGETYQSMRDPYMPAQSNQRPLAPWEQHQNRYSSTTPPTSAILPPPIPWDSENPHQYPRDRRNSHSPRQSMEGGRRASRSPATSINGQPRRLRFEDLQSGDHRGSVGAGGTYQAGGGPTAPYATETHYDQPAWSQSHGVGEAM